MDLRKNDNDIIYFINLSGKQINKGFFKSDFKRVYTNVIDQQIKRRNGAGLTALWNGLE
ncbi:hypothetical protein ACFVSS_23805 [Peribacillus butanolivorans]|uniref:hypothetical protein n=1 Tax=Peribacillus butanolivorans TaxID=421767 RepID=UPI0036DF755B